MSAVMSDIRARPNVAAVIGRFFADGRSQFLPMAHRELLRAQEAAGRVLDTFGFARGSHALLIATLNDAAQVLPLQLAMVARNLIFCTADASPYESARIRSMAQRFDLACVMGINAAALKGLVAAGADPADLFDGNVVWARPDAYPSLQGIGGITLRRWLEIGPALALECRYGEGAHLDGLEWHVEVRGGELFISGRLDRAMTFESLATGLKGTVLLDVCACGHAGPRVVLA
jgi:hypothetical protein